MHKTVWWGGWCREPTRGGGGGSLVISLLVEAVCRLPPFCPTPMDAVCRLPPFYHTLGGHAGGRIKQQGGLVRPHSGDLEDIVVAFLEDLHARGVLHMRANAEMNGSWT